MQSKIGSGKSKARPRKILLARNVAKKRCAIYDTNATESPLLRLPPEIRTRIWRYVLGGNTIHIVPFGFQDKVRHYICRHSCTPEEETMKLKENRTQFHADYINRHRNCANLRDQEYGKLTVPMLQTCRQIHQEAALLPYQLNAFAFLAFDTFKNFVRQLVPVQSRLIECVCIAQNIDSILYAGVGDSRSLSSKLTGLRSLSLIAEFHGAYTENRFTADPNLRMHLARLFAHFHRVHLTTAIVTPCRIMFTARGRMIGRRVSAEMAGDWAEEIERGLLEPYDKRALANQREVERENAAEQDRERRKQARADGRLRALKE